MSDRVRMFELRVAMKGGQQYNFHYLDLGKGEEARKLLASAMNASRAGKPAIFEMFDEAGRTLNGDGAEVSGVQLVDIQQELINATRLQKFVEMTLDQLDPDAARKRRLEAEPVVGSIGGMASSVGGRPSFSE